VPQEPEPGTFVSSEPRLPIAGCDIYPDDHVFRADVRALPVRADSAASIAGAGGTSLTLRAGFTSGIWEGSRAGVPINVVDPTLTRPTDFMVAAVYDEMTGDRRFDVPLPHNPRIEGWPGRAWDKHLLILDPATCRTRELINVQPPGENLYASQFGSWYADAVVEMDLASNDFPESGAVTSGGFSIIGGLIRYDEVAQDELNHVLGVSLPEIRAGDPIWPALGNDGRMQRDDLPQMGSWLRLRPEVDLSNLGPQARVIAEALKVHGAVLGDTGGFFALGGEPDHRWDDDDLAGLAGLSIADFELVDPTPMIVDPGSWAIR
jgi:hypothetical protein